VRLRRVPRRPAVTARGRACPGLTPGLLLVSLGAGLLLREFEYFPRPVRLIDFWPLLLVAVSLSEVIRSPRLSGRLFALTLAGFGVLLELGNLGYLTFPTARLWPVLLVVVGIWFLFRPRAMRGHHHYHHHSQRDAGPRRSGFLEGDRLEERVSENRLVRRVAFSGAQLKVDSQAWQGGELIALFAGIELDLRKAKLDEQGATLELRVAMGGVEIRIPETWSVVCDVASFLGGIDDDSREPQGNPNAPRLTLIGSLTVGGINIRN
jgi:predicted membrane protein